MRAIGLLCVLCSVSTGCIFLESGGGDDDTSGLESCDTSILCMEIDSRENSTAGMTAFEDDCVNNQGSHHSTSCGLGEPVCRDVAFTAGSEGVSIVVDVYYKSGYESATGTAPASDCENLGGNFFGDTADPSCPDPDFPVFCGEFEGDCWSAGVDCSYPAYECGTGRWRCLNGTDYGACCGGTFVTCGSEFPYYCSTDGKCYASDQGCGGCDYLAADCDGV